MINLVQMRDFFIDNLRNAAKKDKNILLTNNGINNELTNKF